MTLCPGGLGFSSKIRFFYHMLILKVENAFEKEVGTKRGNINFETTFTMVVEEKRKMT